MDGKIQLPGLFTNWTTEETSDGWSIYILSKNKTTYV